MTFEKIRGESHRGNASLARAEAERCYQAWQLRPGDKWHWKFKFLAAEMLLLNGETRQAKSLLGSAPPSQFADLQPRFEMLRAYVAFREQNLAEARSLLAAAVTGAHALSDYDLEADSQLLLAAYESPEEATRMEEIIAGILELCERHDLRYQEAAALLDLGWLRIQQSRLAAAVPPLERAAQIAKDADATLLYSASLGNLATCYYRLGDFDKSMELQKQTIAIQEPAGLTTLLRDSYQELGSRQLLQGQTREAIESLRRALALASQDDAPGIYGLIASNLASALAGAGEVDEAERLTRRAIEADKGADSEGRLYFLLNEAGIAEHRGLHDAAVDTYMRVLSSSEGFPDAAWSANAALASIYARKNDAASNRAARRYFAEALRTIEANRADQLQSQYQITFLSALIHFYQDYVAYLLRQGDIEEALLVADSSRASVLTQDVSGLNARENPGLLSRIRAAAHRNRITFLFYFLAPKESYLWIVTDHELKAVTLPGEQELGEQVRSYRRLIEIEKVDPLTSASALPQRLFQTLVGPALPCITPDSPVMIVPDGSLHGLNFETLVAGGPKPHYWIQDVTISIAPSLNILTAAPSARAFRNAAHLIIGDPKSSDADFPALANAGAEMEQVRRAFASGETYMLEGAAAIPAAYRTSQPKRFSTIHIAAHGEVNERSPLDSAIILSPQADGFRLFAREIMEVPLTADLVTLSACRSLSARTLSGEGPVGFAWAFFQAGAENVVASLWDVNDRSTADLMNRFYSAIDHGESYAAALREAKLHMLQTQFQKPYYWAPFQLYSRRFPF